MIRPALARFVVAGLLILRAAANPGIVGMAAGAICAPRDDRFGRRAGRAAGGHFELVDGDLRRIELGLKAEHKLPRGLELRCLVGAERMCSDVHRWV